MTNCLGERAPPFESGGDVEEDELVNALVVVARGKRCRIPRVREAFELHTFDDTSVSDIETGNDAFGEHGLQYPSDPGRPRVDDFVISTKFRSRRTPASPDFSG